MAKTSSKTKTFTVTDTQILVATALMAAAGGLAFLASPFSTEDYSYFSKLDNL